MLVFLEDVVWLLVLIGVMINIHELGHYCAARYFKVRVEAFSFGFGPRLFGFRRGDTDYRFSLIPFGGYVKMAGEQPGDQFDAVGGFLSKPRWQRLIIAFAGPFMNIVLAVGALTGLYMVKFPKVTDPATVAIVDHVAAGSPAAQAGVQGGDRIVAIDGSVNPTWEDIGLKEYASAYRALNVTVERGDRRFNLTVTPTLSERSGVGYAGWDERGLIQLAAVEAGYPADKAGLRKGDMLISASGQPIHSQIKFQEITKNSGGKPIEVEYEREGQRHTVSVQPVYAKLDGPERWMIGVVPMAKVNVISVALPFPAALRESVRQNSKGALLIVQFLQGMAERRMSAKNLTGPIGIAQLSGDAAREGPSAFFMLLSMVSLNLAIFNLLPIPILDGGVILMLLVEMVMQRDLSLNVKEAVFKVGFVCIMALVAFVLYNDISRFLPQG
jgi:regulator of sigma E protease